MDNELFELCKEVYERFPEWNDTLDGYFDGGEVMPFSDRVGVYKDASNYRCPLYTSDFLLEKLPPVIFVRTSDGHNNTAILTVWINGDKTAHVAYMIPFDEQNRGDYARESDTPLKSLLKLVLALKEAGEL